jgi:hypothetical protein
LAIVRLALRAFEIPDILVIGMLLALGSLQFALCPEGDFYRGDTTYIELAYGAQIN